MKLETLLELLEKNTDFRTLLEKKGEGPAVSAAGPLRPFIVSALARRADGPTLVVTARPADAERFAKDSRAFLPETLLLPAPERMAFEPVSGSPVGAGQTFRALNALTQKGPRLVVTSIAGLLRKVPAADYNLHRPLELAGGGSMDLTEASASLGEMGYRRSSLVEDRGEFAVRGGIIDVFPSTTEHPVRIEFFGDEIESVRSFAVNSQRTIEELKSVYIYRCREVSVDEAAFRKAADALSGVPWFAEETGRLREGLLFEGVERFAPLLYERMVTFIDYLHEDGLVVLDGPGEVKAEAARFSESHRLNLERAVAGGTAPALEYYSDPAVLDERPAVVLTSGPSDIVFESDVVQPIMGRLEKLSEEIGRLSERGLSVVVSLNDQGQIKRIAELLTAENIEVSTDGLRPSAVNLAVGEVSSGFILPAAGLALLSYADLFFRRREHRPVRVGQRLTDLADLEVGDYIVHVAHGIARYGGLVKRSIDGMERDYLVLEYAAGDKLFVPVDQSDRIGKYIGTGPDEPTVTRLGSAEWSKAKRKAKQSARKMAYDLLALYADRARAHGYAFSPDAPWQRELEEAFPFEETEDQLVAIDEVKKDMESDQPMDRLVCGDVGFGKTEVALRAAFKVVMDGMQVVVLVPTTILAQQHYETFKDRFAPFPVTVEVLSRFRSPKEQKKVAEGFAEGRVDVLVGTHRVLSKDIAAKNLGLVIVDEEQRFGVAAKEQLKNLKTSVDVLTLSATPIPRTLQMALSGLRDMSVIETPPEDRHPIATYVGPYDEELVRDAVMREKDRDGQCFFVHNHIDTIYETAERLRALVPEATITVAHGRMPERQLEKVMMDFLEKRFDVLISTTIIENGLDIPNVNTLLVDRSDRLGLAQLYQLRGRVGRSDERAYAYFFYEPKALIAPQALDRLKAIGEHTGLGSGTKIALKDLEIRGAGNLLGAEQHGSVASVGFELYCDLLREAIEELEGKAPREKKEASVDLPVDAYIPDEYIQAERLRMEAYRKLARAGEVRAVDALEAELADRYGPVPVEVSNLLMIVRVKLEAARLGLTTVRWSRDAIEIAGVPLSREWEEAALEADGQATASLWMGRLIIREVPLVRALGFLGKLFSGIMAKFEP
ncbi:MAG: transcription-repair coupling factor [Candidatus Aquicultorales bacterium]